MKNLIFTLLTLCLCITSYAQQVKEGSFSILKTEERINFEIDYSQATIYNLDYEDFILGEDDWTDDYHELVSKCMMEANDKLSGIIMFSNKIKTNYKLIFNVIRVSGNGTTNGNTYGNLILMDDTNQIIAEAGSFYGKGGIFGSKTNLMGDAIEVIGEKIGIFLKERIAGIPNE